MARSKTMTFFLALASLLHPAVLLPQSQPPKLNSKSDKNRILRVDGRVPPFKEWLQQDVAWIITPEEKLAFKSLQDDEERDEFVEAFWQRRDPTPDTYENEFKEEHYHRIAYANDHFGSQDPGWKTDRGRIYIVYGAPDKVVSYAAKDSRPQSQDGQDYNGLPSEPWSYRYLEGVGMNVVIDFVDICTCGDYRMRMPDDRRDALLYIPTVVPQTRLGKGDLQLYLKGAGSPKLQFRDLEAKLDSNQKGSAVPLDVKTEITKATGVTSIVNITISFPGDIASSPEAESASSATINVVGRIQTLTGHTVDLFETQVKSKKSSLSDLRVQKSIPLFNGYYRLEIAAENGHAEKNTTWTAVLNVKP